MLQEAKKVEPFDGILDVKVEDGLGFFKVESQKEVIMKQEHGER